MSKPLLLCAIMVKNEEERIVRTISSIADYASCFVILDTGSTDKTCEVIQEYCEFNNIDLKLFKDNFVDFAYSRNILLRHCHGLSEFILLLDANDEVRNAEVLIPYLKEIKKKKQECLFYCNFYWENDNNIVGNSVKYYRIALIRNNITDIKYIYPAHEIIVAPDKFRNNFDLMKTSLCIYQNRLLDKPSDTRFIKDAEVLTKYIEENGDNPRVYRYICQSYRNSNDWENVYYYSNKSINYIENNKLLFNTDIYAAYIYRAQSAYHLKKNTYKNDYIKAHQYHKQLIETCEPYYELATCYYNDNNFNTAFKYIQKACDINSDPEKVPESKINLFKKLRYEFYMELAFLSNNMDKYEKMRNKLINDNNYTYINDPLYRYIISPEKINNNNIKIPDNLNIPTHLLPKPKKIPTKEELHSNTQNYELSILVSYRDRAEHLKTFLETMESFCDYLDIDYHIYILHQNNNDPFNKGLLYNIGTLLLKDTHEKYLCFHDIDIIPTKGTNYYRPLENEVNHLYGYLQTLGGIFTINYDDYVKVNGFSNKYINWGYEDTDFFRRIVTHKINVNNDFFYARYDTYCFKELDEDKYAPVKKMSLPNTLKNKELYLSNIPSEFDGLDKIIINNDAINYTYNYFYTIIDIDTSKIYISST